MNGAEPKIEIIKPFGEAFEMTKKILFQPFNFERWLIIGFAAFLAGHFAGGGFNFPLRNFPPRHANQNFSMPDLEQWKPMLPVIIAAFALIVLAFVIVITWLRARGNFIFTDCIARNRAAIVEPWREYRLEGNSYFLFLLLVMFGAMVIFGLVAALFMVCLPVFSHGSMDHVTVAVLAVFGVLLIFAWICLIFFVGVTSYFMIPLMYVRRCHAPEAFRKVLALILENPGPFILFCLFGFCLLLGVGMISGLATCLTCCLAALPYIGTVILLPVFVCLRAFGLCFIRQFGSDYDVWASTAEPPPIAPPPSPPLAS
jgi:hypothetical protein